MKSTRQASEQQVWRATPVTFAKAEVGVAELVKAGDRRWFRCRYCGDLFVGGPVDKQSVREERDAAFAHEAACRPDKPVASTP